MRILSPILLLVRLAPVCSAFYIPGWSIRSYQPDDPIPLSTNKLTSPNTQLPYAYNELPFVCRAASSKVGIGGRGVGLNLGEVLRGDRIVVSDYELFMGKDEVCKHLCSQTVDREGVERAKELVRENYNVEWIVDNLPGATAFVTMDKSKKYYAAGFKLGVFQNDRSYLHNHVTFVLRWRNMPESPGRRVIVAFEVYTKSIDGPKEECADLTKEQPIFELDPDALKDDETLVIPYTYSVYWKEDNSIEWASRWDRYFVNDEEATTVHWLAIGSSIVIVLMLSVVVSLVMIRTLSRDIQNYNDSGDSEARKRKAEREALEEDDEDTTGWKLVHGDVFRPPPLGGLFAPLIGSGVQLITVITALLILSATGILNPSYRGGLISFGIFLFVFAGIFSGYYSTRMYKTFKGEKWRKNALLTALLFPGFIFSSIFVLNLFVWAKASSTAIPFTTLLALLFMWLCVSLPLVFAGSYLGFQRPVYEHPTRTMQIPRQIPRKPWHLKLLPNMLLAGLIPFAVIFIELLFLFKSLWQDKSSYYYMYGFLGLIATVLGITIAEVSVVSTYFMLSAEDWNWWWRSFAVGAGSAVWVFLCSAWYWWTKLGTMGAMSSVLFFGYSALACAVYAVLVGTVGFIASYAFVRRIYGAIKAD